MPTTDRPDPSAWRPGGTVSLGTLHGKGRWIAPALEPSGLRVVEIDRDTELVAVEAAVRQL